MSDLDSLNIFFEDALREVISSLYTRNLSGQKTTNLPSILASLSREPKSFKRGIVLSGITGSGKTSIGALLQEKGYQKFPNVTTRLSREYENQTDNHFVTNEEFQELEKEEKLFNAHTRNGVSQAILIDDITKFFFGAEKFWMDKSVVSTVKLKNNFPNLIEFCNLIYILPSSLEVLYKRTKERERQNRQTPLSEKKILERFKEEIIDFKSSILLPYYFFINDEWKKTEDFFLTKSKN